MTVSLIDTHEFTRRNDRVSGTEPIAAMPRLNSLLLGEDGALQWSLSGRSELGPDGSRTPFLRLTVHGTVSQRCVRCLEPIAVSLQHEQDYRLVASEAQAEREDPDEDAFDLLVSSRQFDLAGLLEDEAIMALPAAPRHADCLAPQPVAPDRPQDVRAPIPVPGLAALGSLHARRGDMAGVHEGESGGQDDGSEAVPDEPEGSKRGR